MTRLPLLHSPSLCRRGGDVCGDYVDDGKGGCRYFGLMRAEDAAGAYAVPACDLADVGTEPCHDGEIGASLGVSRERVGQVGRLAAERFTRRAKLLRLRSLLDVDRFADKRNAVVSTDDEAEEPIPGLTGNRARVLAAVRSGLERPVDIAEATGLLPRYVSSNLSRLARMRLVSRVGAAHWVATVAPVQCAKESA